MDLYDGISLGHKKEWNLAIVITWISLQGIMLSRISQTEKDNTVCRTYMQNLKNKTSIRNKMEEPHNYREKLVQKSEVGGMGEADEGD